MALVIGNLFSSSIITLFSYFAGLKLFEKFQKPWLNPLYTATIFIICCLAFFHLDIKTYAAGNSVFSLLLGTATVSLAVPLYKQVKLLKKHFFIILWSVIPGTLIGVSTVVLLTKLLDLNHEMMFSLIPKSVTAPIALSISQSMGGIPSLTFLFVVLSAIFSLITGPVLLKLTRIRSSVARGLALGTSAQAMGASRAFEWGELEGAMGSIAMISSALFLSLFTPLLIHLYLL